MDDAADLPPPDEPPPTLPSRLAYLLAFSVVVLAGLLGAVIGYGITDVGCEGDCGRAVAAGTLVGGAVAAGGVGVVAVLVLRAMAEWERNQRRAEQEDQPPTVG